MNVFDYLFRDSFRPEQKFILSSVEEVTYDQIFKDSLVIAKWLNDAIGEKNQVLILLPNSFFFVVVYLGIMKSGNTCIPISPDTEQKNLDYILEVSEISLAFAMSKSKLKFDSAKCQLVNENDFMDIVNKVNHTGFEISTEFDEHRMAQILFTSGSTGHPKGVMLSHKNIIANTNSIIQYLELGPQDIVLVVLPFYYCYGLSLLHTHLKVGGSIVLNNNFIFLGSILSDLKKYRCTGFSGVPSHFQILLRKSESFKTTEFPDLKYVTQAGGKLHNIFIKEFVEAFHEVNFFVMYGQTEATARLSYLPPHQVLKKIGSIGKGIPGVILDVFNKHARPVEKNEIGEVVAMGDNIMMGYLNDSEGTNNTIKDGWLYTGDIATKDKEGYIYLYARKKEIIKVGGKRISPKEIEEVIVSIPYVLSCKINTIYDDILGEAIKAIVNLKDGIDELNAKKEIQLTCKSNLALYKIPKIIEFDRLGSDPLKLSKNG